MSSTDPHSKRSFWWSLRGFFAAFGALATCAAAVIGLFLPKAETPDTANVATTATPAHQQQTPDSRSSPPPPTPASNPSPQPPPPPPPPPPSGPESMGGDISDAQSTVEDPCCTFSAKISLTGFKGEACTLAATLIDADGSETPGDEQQVTAEADTDSARIDAAVFAPEPGTYRARFVLRDPDGTELERFTTDPFDAG